MMATNHDVLSSAAHPTHAGAPKPYVGTGFIGSLIIWGSVVVLLARLGIIARLPTPFLPIPVMLGMGIPVALYFGSQAFRSYIHALDLRALTLFNVWRVPAALAFFWYGARGDLPVQFVLNAGIGDVIAGVLAVPVVFWLGTRPRWRLRSYTAFHLFSFADFVVAVGTGFYFSVAANPLMDTLKLFPMAFIPLFGVPVTGALSVMALHRLWTRRS
jgi:hypothetical protein